MLCCVQRWPAIVCCSSLADLSLFPAEQAELCYCLPQVRVGLVDLVAGDAGLSPANVPEVLGMDAPKLHAAANAFQGLLVQATCLLLLAQAAGRPVADAQGEQRGPMPLWASWHCLRQHSLLSHVPGFL